MNINGVLRGFSDKLIINLTKLAEWTGLEPATPGVTGRYSNQLNYHSAIFRFEFLTKLSSYQL